MSDSSQGGPPPPPHNPYGGGSTEGENPYGQPPSGGAPGAPSPADPPTNPYGQSQPPAAGQPAHNPYGQPQPPAYQQGQPQGQPQGQWQGQHQGQQQGQESYGHYVSPYGQQPAGPLGDGLDMYGRPLGNDERPGTVTAAGWITIILSGISALLFGFLTLALLVAKDTIITEINKELIRQDAYGDFNADDFYGVFLAVMVVFTAWCVIACVLAVFAMRRSNVARILLVISSIVSALLSLLAIGSAVSAVWLLASVAVAVMLFTGGANAWYAGRRRF